MNNDIFFMWWMRDLASKIWLHRSSVKAKGRHLLFLYAAFFWYCLCDFWQGRDNRHSASVAGIMIHIKAYVRKPFHMFYKERTVSVGPACILLNDSEGAKWIETNTHISKTRYQFNSSVCNIRFCDEKTFQAAQKELRRTSGAADL